jgi:hypothetical protein
MSQVPTPLSTTRAAHSAHASLYDLRGSNSPQAHWLPSTAQIHARQVPWLLPRQIYTMWPNVPSPKRSWMTWKCTP